VASDAKVLSPKSSPHCLLVGECSCSSASGNSGRTQHLPYRPRVDDGYNRQAPDDYTQQAVDRRTEGEKTKDFVEVSDIDHIDQQIRSSESMLFSSPLLIGIYR
jgi:hypothetical protein